MMNCKPVAYACQIVEADFETNIIKIEMIDKDYKVSAGIKYLSDTYPSEHDLGIAEAIGFEKGYKASHPVKELTDEEMMKAEYEFMYWNRSLDKPLVKIAYELGVFNQAVAILRKANEK